MSGFFTTIADKPQKHALWAVWIISGEAQGAKGLFEKEEDRLIPVFVEDRFPESLAGQLTDGPIPAADDTPGLKPGLYELSGSRLFIEPLAPGRKLVICGAGHVSMPIIQIARLLDFEITVIEDREEFAKRAGEAGAHHVLCGPFEEMLSKLPGDDTTAFVIVTRSHSHDTESLRMILQKEYAYAGMMGSRTRTDLIRAQMLAEGFDPERIQNVHMPIGLSIHSRTPEEIAVSIMAQIIQVMNGANEGEAWPKGLAEELARAETGAAVLAMIVEKKGEAPRRPGTKMLIREDGSFLGTVGGGLAEAKILQAAREMLAGNETKSRLVTIEMTKGAMQCGGEVTVFLLPL